MNNKTKLLNVTMEFEDEISELEGEDAQKWIDWLNKALAIYQTRSYAYNPELNFKITQKEEKP